MKILPIIYPIITTTPITSDLLATIGMYEKVIPWICNNFNQIIYAKNNGNGEMDSYGTLFESQSKENNIIFLEIPFIKCNKIKKKLLDGLISSFAEFVIKCINNDYYVRVALNYKYLSNNNCDEDFNHTILIYGYSFCDKVFYGADFHDGKKYDFYKYSFEDIEAAYSRSFGLTSILDEYLEDVIVYKVRDDMSEMEIDIAKIREELTGFLMGTDESRKYKNSYRWRNFEFLYGINYFDELMIGIADSVASPSALHTLCDYFKMLQFKLKVLEQRKYIEEKTCLSLLKELEACEQQSVICRNLYLKYRMTNSVDTRNKIIDKYRDLKMLCKDVVENIVVALS